MLTAESGSPFADLNRVENELLSVYEKHLPNRAVGYRLFYLCGIARRALAQSRAFKNCVNDRNGLVGLAILRLQLDTVLRLYALYWVADAEVFAQEVFQGCQIDRIKDADGNLMKDRHLINKLMPKNPWVESVYKNTSGLIHFSDRHMRAAIHVKDAEQGAFEIVIGPNDRSHKESDFDEMIAAFFHVTTMIKVAVDDWFERVDPRRLATQSDSTKSS